MLPQYPDPRIPLCWHLMYATDEDMVSETDLVTMQGWAERIAEDGCFATWPNIEAAIKSATSVRHVTWAAYKPLVENFEQWWRLIHSLCPVQPPHPDHDPMSAYTIYLHICVLKRLAGLAIEAVDFRETLLENETKGMKNAATAARKRATPNATVEQGKYFPPVCDACNRPMYRGSKKANNRWHWTCPQCNNTAATEFDPKKK